MKITEIRPSKVTANDDLKKLNNKQVNNPIDINYNTGNPLLEQQLNLLVGTVCNGWPETESNKEKASLALAGALLNSGWVALEVQHLLESVLKITGDLNSKNLTAVDRTEHRIKLGKPVYGWPTLAGLIGDDLTAQIQHYVGSIDDGDNNGGTQIEILDNAPLEVRKPLCLIENHAYAATWLHVKFTETETVDKDGKITKLNPPQQKKERRLAIINEDGEVIYDKTQRFYELGFSVILSEIPQAEKIWSSHGVRRFKDGERVEAQRVFHEIKDVLDAFIDFDKSFGEQNQMSELLACYILGTWFLDAFNVIGFIWPNGERGSGKTQLLTLISQLSYLGQLLVAGGTYASLRDLADYGATLCFDDAENMSSPKFDGDKRTLLLAGNRRGSCVTVKESVGVNKWRNRYVNTYCARAFSAINMPDAVLASRTIVVPLIRTGDKKKANNDPQDFKHWPHDYRRLVDDLWALALANLSKLSSYDNKISELASLSGRNLEPWRAILAVALWLDEQGIDGLWERMHQLALNYQTVRQELDTGDINTLIIRALCKCLKCEVVKLCEDSEVYSDSSKVFLLTSEIVVAMILIAEDEELNIDPSEIDDVRRIGIKLKALGFSKHRQGGTGKSGWHITRKELAHWVKALSLVPVKDE